MSLMIQVGQHLLTVPQQLEMMMAGEEDGDNLNLRTALTAGTLPYYRKGTELEEYVNNMHTILVANTGPMQVWSIIPWADMLALHIGHLFI